MTLATVKAGETRFGPERVSIGSQKLFLDCFSARAVIPPMNGQRLWCAIEYTHCGVRHRACNTCSFQHSLVRTCFLAFFLHPFLAEKSYRADVACCHVFGRAQQTFTLKDLTVVARCLTQKLFAALTEEAWRARLACGSVLSGAGRAKANQFLPVRARLCTLNL